MGLRLFFLLCVLASFFAGWAVGTIPSPEKAFWAGIASLGIIVLVGIFAYRKTSKQILSFLSRPQMTHFLSWATDLLDPLYEGTVRLYRDREEASRKLKEAMSRFSAVMDHMEEGVVVTDLKGKILLVNRAFFRFFKVEGDVRGESFGLLARKTGINDLIEDVLQNHRSVQKEVTFSETTPARTWSLVGTTARGSGETDVFGIFLLFDLTDIRQLERIRKDFVANVSHEIRTPLTSIRGFAEALHDGGINDPKTAREFSGIILSHAERLGNIVSDLLHLSELETGKAVMRYGSVSLSRQIAHIRDVYADHARKKGIRFTVQLPEETLTYETDEGKMDLVLGNLVDNALKYTPEGGEVFFGGWKEGDAIVFEVRDSGVGIPRTEVDRIFERFYRVDRARSREMGGTGLGLSIVRHILEILQGTVRVTSSPGQGSTFFVRVPSREPAPSGIPAGSK
ncbi:ATP-binding protein [Leptospirillum ferriphilum]|uniref:ATP-binding protein n=1 Tax=Leptospirillum ferriphilum TaxID=178606 RepID=UPI0006B1A14C|nr:ATP-binding protein [Leptospirillum ferriphilum]MCL5259186.1 cell wall metabolism sensor histidine kinase WalK [Nitrospirota bacterium]OOH79113.1 hypothetical protein BOX30_07030 [Leptospirillum ferriphilum]